METAIEVTQQDGVDRVAIVGPINEEAEVHLANVVSKLGSDVIVNFRQVTFINSLGVRAWINFIRALDGKKLRFEECTPEIVNQINMIPNFKGSAEILSVYGTYYCDDCGSTQDELFTVGKNMPKSEDFELPPVKCNSCGAEEIEFEEVEEAFFNFCTAS